MRPNEGCRLSGGERQSGGGQYIHGFSFIPEIILMPNVRWNDGLGAMSELEFDIAEYNLIEV